MTEANIRIEPTVHKHPKVHGGKGETHSDSSKQLLDPTADEMAEPGGD